MASEVSEACLFNGDGSDQACRVIAAAINATTWEREEGFEISVATTKRVLDRVRADLVAAGISFAWSECYIDRANRLAVAVKLGDRPLIATLMVIR